MEKQTVYVFIDSQNLNLGVRDLGWKLDFKKFFIYLKDKYRDYKLYVEDIRPKVELKPKKMEASH